MLTDTTLLTLLQWVSPALPIGGFNYSEGIETLVAQQHLTTAAALEDWLTFELRHGSAQLEAAVIVRAYRAVEKGDLDRLRYWNSWLSAVRETEELRAQNWQMGTALMALVQTLEGDRVPLELQAAHPYPWNTSVAFSVAAAIAPIPLDIAVLGYLQSWLSTLISAAVKLVPLGQTAGQVLLRQLRPHVSAAVQQSLDRADADLESCTLGLALASMQHETQYSRLFRS